MNLSKLAEITNGKIYNNKKHQYQKYQNRF